MDFREVWMNTDVIGDDENPRVEEEKTCGENLKNSQDYCFYLVFISIFLFVLNVICVVFFKRFSILKAYRNRFQRLPVSETASSIFRGAFDHDAFDTELKG